MMERYVVIPMGAMVGLSPLKNFFCCMLKKFPPLDSETDRYFPLKSGFGSVVECSTWDSRVAGSNPPFI